MTKQQILELTGLTEDQFYDQYPDQESFCQDYPEACAQLQQAQEGINVVEQVSPSLRNQIGVNTQGNVGVVAYTPQVQPMVRDEYGNLRRPKTHDRMGRPIGPMVQTFDKIPVVNKPGGYINPEFEGYASNQPTTGWQTTTGMWNRPGAPVNAPYIDRSKTLQPLKVLAPIVNNYNLPKELVKGNLQTVPLKDFGSMQTLQKAMTPMQTMYNVGSIGAPSSVKLNKFSSVVDLLKSKGKDSSFAERKKLAEEVGIKNYTGSAAQNTQLMDYVSKMKKGGIYINPANKGKFTESANRAGMGVQEFARHVLANKEDYSTTQIRRANFARNAAKWKHQDGGMIEYRQGGQPCYECGGMYERGGTAIFPAMRTMFKHGGYYGMDGRFHRNTDSGTYVMDGGYYFQAGGTPVASPSTPPTTGAPVDIPANQGWSPAGDGGFNIDTNFQYDVEDENQTDPALGGGMDGRQSRRRRSSDLYETPDLGGLTDEYQTDEQPMDEQPVYDASQYSSAVDPSTGFTTWSKNNKQLTNIKKQDPALWAQLKEEGRGARFRTGQTGVQKFGRAAGKIANTMQAGVELAGAIGNVLNERNRRRNMDAAAMNMGSTAAMFTNPQSAGKGDYGVTGSSYGAFKPYSTGTLSYKGMYGRYGMQVPKYAVGGYTPDIATLSDYGLEGKPEVPEVEFRDFGNITTPFIPSAPIVSPVDNLTTNIIEPVSKNKQSTIKSSVKNYPKASVIPNPSGKDVATKLNNPGNIIFNPVFAKMFGATKSSIKQVDGPGYFAAFPNLEAGLKARETQLFGEVDGVFQSRYYNPDTSVDQALKTWSNKGYGVEIYPQLKGKTLQEVTPAERKELMKRQIKAESGSMFKMLQKQGLFKNGGEQFGGQVIEMDEDQIQQFLAAGGQLEFID